MTGGRAVILGETGRNFAAGMSGGIAYVLDEQGKFPPLVNREMVELEDLSDPSRSADRLDLVRKHVEYTDSARGRYVLDNWDQLIEQIRQGHAARLQARPGRCDCRAKTPTKLCRQGRPASSLAGRWPWVMFAAS